MNKRNSMASLPILAGLILGTACSTQISRPSAPQLGTSVAATLTALPAPANLPSNSVAEDSVFLEGWITFHSDALRLSVRYPPDWGASERDGIIYLGSPELYGEGERYGFSVYISEIPNTRGLSFQEVIARENLALMTDFRYSEERIGDYLVYRTTRVSSIMGMLSFFFVDGDRLVEVELDPYRDGEPWEGQPEHAQVFGWILTTVRFE